MIASRIQEIITFKVVVSFTIGILCGQIGNWLNYRWRKHKRPDTVVQRNFWEAVVGIVTVVVLIWIMIATQQARNCAITLNTTLQVEITAGRMEREAFQTAVVQRQNLPQDLRGLPDSDPRKAIVLKPIEEAYFKKIAIATKLREDNKEVRESAQRACGHE